MRLLLVEDAPDMAWLVRCAVSKAGYAVDVAATCCEAENLAIENEYDLIVLDLVLPDGCGLDLLIAWRREGLSCPVLILTCRRGPRDKIRGLDAGADDYLTKPFDVGELLARLRCLLRRRAAAPVRILTCGDVSLDRTRLRVCRGDTRIDLTPKELSLLEHFMLHPGQVLSRHSIAEHVWNDRYRAQSNVIDVYVGLLRHKLEARGGERLIVTVRGLGYVLRQPPGRELAIAGTATTATSPSKSLAKRLGRARRARP